MIAYGWASIMLCTGMLLRAKISFLRNQLVPSSVIAGILGILFMNITASLNLPIGIHPETYNEIVNHLFTISFISISLTSAPKNEQTGTKHIMQGAVGMGIIWCLLYALTPIVGSLIVMFLGESVSMESVYGMLIPFAFCQGPGQSASFGTIFEQYGWTNATTVAIFFSVLGFIAAFLIGVPAAKLGIRKGIAKHCGKINESILKGYLTSGEQTETMIRDTTCSSNIETLTFHFALVGLCFIIAVGISRLLRHIPGFLGSSMSGMMFMNGMYAAYLVKWLLKKLNLEFLQENVLQSKITGWSADYLVVSAFMAVSFSVIQKWIVPIMAEVLVITILTFFVCFYFGQRFGGNNDFERTLGLYGTSTGTVPSGIALIRIVDPEFKTTTAIELGIMNLVMLLSTPVYITILAVASRTISISAAMLILSVCCMVYLILLKVTHTWNPKTYSWKG